MSESASYTFTMSSSAVAGGISAYFNVDTTNPQGTVDRMEGSADVPGGVRP